MKRLTLPGDPEITVELRQNARARRLSLRVSQLDGRVTLTLPRFSSQADAQKFALQKEEWLRRQVDKCAAKVTISVGGHILFEGQNALIIGGHGRAVSFEKGAFRVPGNAEKVPPRLAAYLKTLARQRLGDACDRYAERLGVEYHRISLRDTRSRWGSCTREGNLMFSWRLVMAPVDVLDYVAAHEVAHLLKMNHSPDFWALVVQICPNFDAPRRWLRRNGALLHSFEFPRLTNGAVRGHAGIC